MITKFFTTALMFGAGIVGIIALFKGYNPEKIMCGIFCIFVTGWAIIKQWGEKE